MATRILLIEDDAQIAEVVARGLREYGYKVLVAGDGAAGLRLAQSEPVALVILDVMLPKLDGWSVCRELRAERNTVPILMLTARDAVTDRVRGLEMGADDYLPKPFDFVELAARVRALLRRDKVHKARSIRISDLEIDTLTRRVLRAGHELRLTPREFALLEALASAEGRVLTREALQDQVWMGEPVYSNTVDVYIGLLRKKVDSGRRDRLVQTVHGVGYRMAYGE